MEPEALLARAPDEDSARAHELAELHPIVRLLDDTVVGCELRWQARSPLAAERERVPGTDADLARIAAAFATASAAALPTLFVPVELADALGPRAASLLGSLAASAEVRPGSVMLELVETVPVSDLVAVRTAAAELRDAGFRLAVKDAGSRHVSMLAAAELHPDAITITRRLVRGVHASGARRALLVSLLSLATHIDARVIADGVDNEEDLDVLRLLGVQFGIGERFGPSLRLPVGAAAEAGGLLLGGRASTSFPAGLSNVGEQRGAETQRTTPGETQPSLPHALSSAALALQAEHDPQRILAVIADQLSRVVPVDDLSIYEADHGAGRFVAVHATGPQSDEILADAFPLTVGLNGWAFTLGTPQNLGNAGAHPAAVVIPNTPFEHESLLLIPLVAGDHKLGMLNCRRMGLNQFTDEDLEAATLFGHTAAAAWHNAQLYEELARRAMTDGLTGLFNSRWLREAGEREIADCSRRAAPLSLVLVDLDHFKRINDTGGHAAGDVVLQGVAEELRRTTRAGDAAVRLGGEEFILILRDSDSAGALRVANDLRRALARVAIPEECHGVERITASIGIASFPADGRDLAELVRAADVAMYVAKHEGRDRVTLAGQPGGTDEGSAVA